MKDLRILDVRESGLEIDVTLYGGKDNLFGAYSFYSVDDNKRRDFKAKCQLWADLEIDVEIGRSTHGRTFIKNSQNGNIVGEDMPCKPHASRSEKKGAGNPKDWGLEPPFPKFFKKDWEE